MSDAAGMKSLCLCVLNPSSGGVNALEEHRNSFCLGSAASKKNLERCARRQQTKLKLSAKLLWQAADDARASTISRCDLM